FQFPLDSLNAIMKTRAGMGQTGETYLVGSDLLMRSDSFLDPDHHSVVASYKHPEKGQVDTEAVHEAIKGKTGEGIITDYNGNPVLSAYTPLNFEGLKWALLSEIDEAEAFAAEKALQWVALVISLVGVVGIVAVALLIARSIARPIKGVVTNLTELAQGEGDLTLRLPVTGKDEVGELAQRFNDFMENLQTMIRDIGGGVETLASSSTELSAISQQMAANAEQTSGKAGQVSTASEEMSSNMSTVAAAMEQSSTNASMVATAAEEMNATISEIAQNAEKARGISDQAVTKVGESTQQMDALGHAANAIGKVVEAITDISEQVNLLALNATIEAARAGDAGKGFAVVANEIKELAKQTAEATLDIKEKIANIQTSSGATLDGIHEISQVISEVNDIVATIAASVEEQTSATTEISENINQASAGIQEVTESVTQSSTVAGEITQNITEVNQAAAEMASGSGQVKTSAGELSTLSETLNKMVARFKV
ncbi:MAG: methyl-accepting chemotaxis protein, partial [Desulfosarcinaceae bacterium]